MSKQLSTLVATLGGQAQVVTFGLDCLLRQGYAVDEVVAVHLSGERYNRAFQQLAAAFPGDHYAGQPCHFRGVALRRQERILHDIVDIADGNVTWRTLHELIAGLKQEGRRLHLLLAGGRRLMALMAMSAAMLHLEHGDQVWHLYTPDAVRERARDGACLHVAPEEGVRLIEVPLAPFGAYFPGLRPLLNASPAEVIAERTQRLDEADQTRCRAVVARLTARELEVLREFASGYSPQAVAQRLSITPRTVDAHKTVILAECRTVWELPLDSHLSYHFLREHFSRFFSLPSSV